MEMREWLSIAFIVVIALILLDGFRRKWLARRDSLRIKLDRNIPPENDGFDYDFNHELPNGGARSTNDDDEAPYYGSQSDDDYIDDEIEDGKVEPSSQEEIAPVHTDTVESQEDDDYDHDDSEDYDYIVNEDDTEYEQEDENVNSLEDEEEFEEELYDAGSDSKERIEPSFGSEPSLEDVIDEVMVAEDQTELFIDHGDSDTESEEEEAELQAPEEVIVFNVMAKQGEVFTGKALLPILMEQGMRLGDMSIFHRHGDMSGNGPVMFSMANMVKPGTFNISEMEEFTTPGISFFLQLPNPIGNMPCFEIMLAAVNAVKDGLDGELKDENRNVITHQALEHSREIIRDFELKQLSGK